MMLKYDFSFAEAAIQWLETGDVAHMKTLESLAATQHIFNHAQQFNPNTSTESKAQFLMELLPLQNKALVPQVKQNIAYAKQHIMGDNKITTIVLQYLPVGFAFNGTLFFTFGYDIGVAFGENCSLNLAHCKFIENPQEMVYYAIHELHHTGFIKIEGHMPSLQITTHREMATIVAYLIHLEGMGTYAPLSIRQQENAMHTDNDYIALQDEEKVRDFAKEVASVYRYFTQTPEAILTPNDWGKLNILAGEARGSYIAGAYMAQTIDKTHGREALVQLISRPSHEFIETYLP